MSETSDNWIESAMSEFLDRLDEIEGDATQAAQVAQDPQARRDVMMERAREIFRKHWKGEADAS